MDKKTVGTCRSTLQDSCRRMYPVYGQADCTVVMMWIRELENWCTHQQTCSTRLPPRIVDTTHAVPLMGVMLHRQPWNYVGGAADGGICVGWYYAVQGMCVKWLVTGKLSRNAVLFVSRWAHRARLANSTRACQDVLQREQGTVGNMHT